MATDIIARGMADNAKKLAQTKADLVDGKVPASQLPSYVSTTIEVNSYTDLPATGAADTIYVTKDDGHSYRWTGSRYLDVSDANKYYAVSVDNMANMGALRTYIDGINQQGLHCFFDFHTYIQNAYVCTVLMFTSNDINYCLIFDSINGRTFIDYNGYQDSETIANYVNRNQDDLIRSIRLTDVNVTLGDVNTMLGQINLLGHHVLFDVSNLNAGAYLCSIEMGSTTVKVLDIVTQKSVSVAYAAATTLVSVLAQLTDFNVKVTAQDTNKIGSITVGGTTYNNIPFQYTANSQTYVIGGWNASANGSYSFSIGGSAYSNGSGAMAFGSFSQAVGNNTVSIGWESQNRIESTISFDKTNGSRTLQLYDPTKIFFRNENVSISKTTFAQYTNGHTLQESLENVAPNYSETSAYAVGDLALHNGLLYKCTTAITTAEAWDATKWTATKVKDIVKIASYDNRYASLDALCINGVNYKCLPLGDAAGEFSWQPSVKPISIGTGASINSPNSLTIGTNSKAHGYWNLAVGHGAIASGTSGVSHNATAIGCNAECYSGSVAVGSESKTNIGNTISFDTTSGSRTHLVFSESNIFFRKELISMSKTTYASYTSGYTLNERLNGLTYTYAATTEALTIPELSYDFITEVASVGHNLTVTTIKTAPTSTGTSLSCKPTCELHFPTTAAITLTLPSGTYKLRSNNPSITLSSNTLSIPSGCDLFISVIDGSKIMIYDWNF